ncbi:MAG: hypothetical protein SNJ71_07290 [Bacteroidales bacterium]
MFLETKAYVEVIELYYFTSNTAPVFTSNHLSKITFYCASIITVKEDNVLLLSTNLHYRE